MGKCDCYGPLQQLLDWSMKRRIGGKKGTQGLDRLEEAVLLFDPTTTWLGGLIGNGGHHVA
jgi:hypothetical protein